MSNNENKLVPKLRFPEFKDNGEWGKKKLGELCDYWNGASHEKGVSDEGDYFLLSLNSIDIDGNLKSDMKKLSYTDNSLQRNDLVMVLSDVAHGNFLGLTDIIPTERYVLNQRMARLRIRDLNEVNPYFLRAYINKSQKYFKRKGQGSSQLNLAKSSVTGFPIIIPPKKQEQQKIAACLSSLDKVITAENQKLELLKEHKKGLLQNLFPQEGETVPKLRFKEFENSGEWEEKELGSFCNSLSSGNDKNFEDGEYELYGSTGVIGRTDNASYEGAFILVARVGANAGYLNKVKGKFGVTDNTLVIDLNKKDLVNFIFYSLESVGLNKLVFGSGQPLITGGELKSFLILIPSSEKEQQKIAETLSSLDDLITAQSQRIEALKMHKKGLLQGLFPNVNEVTK